MSAVCIGVVLDDMNPKRLGCLRKSFGITTATEPPGLRNADAVLDWISGNVSHVDRLVIVTSYEEFGEVELVKLLEGLEEQGWGEDAVVCGFESFQRGDKAVEGLSEYSMENRPFEFSFTDRELSISPIHGART